MKKVKKSDGIEEGPRIVAISDLDFKLLEDYYYKLMERVERDRNLRGFKKKIEIIQFNPYDAPVEYDLELVKMQGEYLVKQQEIIRDLSESKDFFSRSMSLLNDKTTHQ